jgi:hypothetical protein
MAEKQEHKEPESGTEGDHQTEIQEREHAHKLPAKTDPAQERGERISTGKAIATGGKSAHSLPDRPEKEAE